MNNKGFTLIEVLAIILILAVIMIIAAPNISKEITKSNEENKKILREKIENAAHIYAGKYYATDIVNGEGVSFELEALVNDGLLELKDDECSDKLENNIIVSDGEFDFEAIEDNNCYTQKEE